MGSATLWDTRHRKAWGEPQACPVLREHPEHLPERGEALDLACGRGGNALWLARHGRLTVHAWDRSVDGIRYLRAQAAHEGLPVQAEVRDVVLNPPRAEQYDVLAVSYFLDRGLMPALVAAVRPGGVLYYQTFLAGHTGAGPGNPDYLLHPGELAEYCANWQVLHALEQEGQAQWVARRKNLTGKATQV